MPAIHESNALREGREAYSDDLPRTFNPYLLGTQEAKDWNRGWITAEQNDPLKFEDDPFADSDSEDD